MCVKTSGSAAMLNNFCYEFHCYTSNDECLTKLCILIAAIVLQERAREAWMYKRCDEIENLTGIESLICCIN